MAATTNLPAIQHPLSRMGNPANLNVRGTSRDGPRVASRQSLNLGESKLRPITADQMPWRLTKSSNGHNQRSPRDDLNLGNIPEGIEVRRAEDPSKPTIPIFGSRADMASRVESRMSRLSSAAASSRGPDKASVDEFEYLLREKMKTGYFTIKNLFKQRDPENKGIVSRESLSQILTTFVGKPISLSQFNKLMVRLNLDHKKMIAYDEFYAAFRPPKKADEGPAWLELEKPNMRTMTASQVHAHLKEKAKQRFLDVAELIPQMNPGGSGRILRPELRNVLNQMGFYMDDDEFEKLWLKYDTENVGTIRAEKLMGKLGISIKPGSTGDMPRSPRKLEVERKVQLDIERWLKRKFREGFSDMKHAFMELDLDRTGRVRKDDFRKVLAEFDLKLSTDKQVEDFLARCGVTLTSDDLVPYKEFLRRFQDRSQDGMPHKILANQLHRYHHSDQGSQFSTTSAVEARLMDLFQRDFLALLGTFHNIDRNDCGLLTQQQFRAAIEGRFELGMSDEEYEDFLTRVPINNDGMVKYVEFMSKFDTTFDRDNNSLFDRSSVLGAPEPMPPIREKESPPGSPRKHRGPRPVKTVDSYDSQDGRSAEELKRVIKNVLVNNFQDFEQAFYDLDELNSKRLTPEMMRKLLKKFDVDVNRNEIKRLWDTFITDQRGHLEYLQFVRHFGYSIGSAAFPNAKVSPPKRGDNDFMMRSNKLNSDVDMLFDQLKSKVDFHWDRLRGEFAAADPNNAGFVSREAFKEILQDLCIELTDYELSHVTNKFDPKNENRVSYVKFLEPYAKRRRRYFSNNMGTVMNHPQAELPMYDIVPKPNKGLSGITAKLRQKLSGEWKNLRKAFRKLDLQNDGYLSIPEFRSVLRLCNTVLEEDEIYHLLSELDSGMSGNVNYREFLTKVSS
ncbi:EF-hand calcium-binding domain-containing protein 6 [Nematostella vectensis]|nr:EF-hand calcium-binding domain-containing protein 6 [Nematostella vectensis]